MATGAGYGTGTNLETATISGKITLNSATSFSLSGATALDEAGLDPVGGTATGLVNGHAAAAATYTVPLPLETTYFFPLSTDPLSP